MQDAIGHLIQTGSHLPDKLRNSGFRLADMFRAGASETSLFLVA